MEKKDRTTKGLYGDINIRLSLWKKTFICKVKRQMTSRGKYLPTHSTTEGTFPKI